MLTSGHSPGPPEYLPSRSIVHANSLLFPAGGAWCIPPNLSKTFHQGLTKRYRRVQDNLSEPPGWLQVTVEATTATAAIVLCCKIPVYSFGELFVRDNQCLIRRDKGDKLVYRYYVGPKCLVLPSLLPSWSPDYLGRQLLNQPLLVYTLYRPTHDCQPCSWSAEREK